MTREVRVRVPGGELVAWEAGEGTDQDAYESLERLEQPDSFTELLAGFLPA